MFGQIEGPWKASRDNSVGFTEIVLPEGSSEVGAEALLDRGEFDDADVAKTDVPVDGQATLTTATNDAPAGDSAEVSGASEKTDSALEDEKLVERARLGDRSAFNDLIQKHYTTCLKRAMYMIRNRSDAEDEVQNACWKAFQRLEQYRGEGTFSAWLSRIVENQCLMRIREERKSSFVYLDESTESNVRLELVGQRADPEDELGEQQVANLIRREILLIPPLLRNVMLLRDVEQLPMPDVASRLGVSVPAAKSRLMRARAELRLRVAKHCGPKGCATLTHRARYKQAAYLRAS